MRNPPLGATMVVLASLLWLLPVCALEAAKHCGPAETTLIDSEVTCFDSGGVDIGYMGEEGLKVACLRDKRVQTACGLDGRGTRLDAYRQWFLKLKQTENSCTSRGGSFRYEDPRFSEPSDENFCMPAQPEIGSTMFESATCNFRSVCPSVTVVCEFNCRSAPRVITGDSSPSLPAIQDEALLQRIVQRR